MGKHRHSSERKKPFLVRNKDGISVGSRKSHTVASSSRKPPHDTEKTIQTHRSLTYRPSQSAETLPSGPWRDITLPVSPRPVARYVQALTSVPLSYETGPKYNPTGPPRESTASLNYPSRTLPEDDEENMVIVTFEPDHLTGKKKPEEEALRMKMNLNTINDPLKVPPSQEEPNHTAHQPFPAQIELKLTLTPVLEVLDPSMKFSLYRSTPPLMPMAIRYEDQEETHNQFQPDRVVGLSGENFWEYYSACLAEVDSDD
ncbi:hypothetical protein TREMEDRAFT_64874 [Tremella mesenterica DSM 1558]|uniref:uncharacterized protein n=1 Tax=Tremella mesenterica (strain ATCC 24925 / CBS 8224 / DSM 1558 / NBRC 9311 / NRRL Y-6157 / RJB 2259-6 / UBC 559-6) TaxID=578456 RepID=UPI0003F48C73|nr:uncharacterized protein TREMEDRAFT_64874 [Tremella mesenterica DSM 1558]EIW67007.1 hypothetical protein TREMEDRAFT_64874 [Tremella mesenterica DSM 1558]